MPQFWQVKAASAFPGAAWASAFPGAAWASPAPWPDPPPYWPMCTIIFSDPWCSDAPAAGCFAFGQVVRRW